jgi:soluble lytic murein transglycosylase-like protein
MRFVRYLTFVVCAWAAIAALPQQSWARSWARSYSTGTSRASYRHSHRWETLRREAAASRGFATRHWRRGAYVAQQSDFTAPFGGFGSPPVVAQEFDEPVQNGRPRRIRMLWQQQQFGWRGENWNDYASQQQNYPAAPRLAGYSENYYGTTTRTNWRYTQQDFGDGAQVQGMAEQAASANGVPMSLVDRVIKRESGGNPRAVSSGNYGLMQIRLGTAREMGYGGSAAGLLDPTTNLTYAVRYLAGAYRAAGGNEDRAVALYARGYNAPRLREASLYGGEPEGATTLQQGAYFDSYAPGAYTPVAAYRTRHLRRRVL